MVYILSGPYLTYLINIENRTEAKYTQQFEPIKKSRLDV